MTDGPVTHGARLVRYTACVSVDAPDETLRFVRWLRENAVHVVRIGGNTGCRCCVELFDIEVDARAAALPADIAAASDFTSGGALTGGASSVAEVLAELEGEP